MQNVSFHPKAKLEIADASEYLERERPDYGRAFQFEVDEGITLILDDPERWPVKERGFRKYLVQRFGYLIWYRETTDDEIYVIAVHHSSRKT